MPSSKLKTLLKTKQNIFKKKNKYHLKRNGYLQNIINFFFKSKHFKNYKSLKKKFLVKFLLMKKLVKAKIFLLASKERHEFSGGVKKINTKGRYYSLLKKIKIEKYLSIFLNSKVELKLKNFLKSSKVSFKFKSVYKNFFKTLLLNKVNFFNRQFKEIYSSLSIGVYLSKARLIMNLFSLVIGFGRYRYLKKNLYYLFNLLECVQKVYSFNNCIRINISGKFKGKAKRTQLKYLRTLGAWNIRSFNKSIIDFQVGFVATRTGIFGIKLWLN